jgi:P-type E1-E2 ATPase
VLAAERLHLTLGAATNVNEDPGRGVLGQVSGRHVAVGSPRWAREHCDDVIALDNLPPADPAETLAIVLVDHRYAGTIVFADALRPGLTEFFTELGTIGITRTLLLSGDRPDRVENVAHQLGVREARGDLLPEGKVDAVRELVAAGHRVMMIGDGVNDAPALTAATVGLALAAHGGGIAAESADCVLLADDLRLVPHAMKIARRTLSVAKQSIVVGIGLSLIAMGLAATGVLVPVAGAMVQEVIDVAVILNAIRAAGTGHRSRA